MVYEFDQQKLASIIRENGVVTLPIIEPTKKQEIEPVATSDHQPCGDCGGIFFLRTGTCHVCQTCGASQGCS